MGEKGRYTCTGRWVAKRGGHAVGGRANGWVGGWVDG